MRLDEVRVVPAIPVLGTGKTDYKVLRAQITAGDMVGQVADLPQNPAGRRPAPPALVRPAS
jgi:hypothetical protein